MDLYQVVEDSSAAIGRFDTEQQKLKPWDRGSIVDLNRGRRQRTCTNGRDEGGALGDDEDERGGHWANEASLLAAMQPALEPDLFPPLPVLKPAGVGVMPTLSINGSYLETLKPTLPRIVKKNFDEVGENYKRAAIYNNKPGVFYTEEEVDGMSSSYHFALVGKFSGPRPNQATILHSFGNLGLSSFYNIRFLRFGYVFIHLSSNEDMSRLWMRGIWYIAGVPMRIFKWSPKFTYEVESYVVSLWIQLPDLSIHMFCKSALFAAANIVGRPPKVDEPTVDGSQLSTARVCVEIDLLKSKIEEFWIDIGEDK